MLLRVFFGKTPEDYIPQFKTVIFTTPIMGMYILDLYLITADLKNTFLSVLFDFLMMIAGLVCAFSVMFAIGAILLSPLFITGRIWTTYQVFRLRGYLRGQGYPELTERQLRQIHRAVGSSIYRLPPYHELATLPGFSLENPQSLAKFVECLPRRMR